MIVIKAILIDGTYSAESVPDTLLGSNFDGENFYYFESEEEKTDYYKNL